MFGAYVERRDQRHGITSGRVEVSSSLQWPKQDNRRNQFGRLRESGRSSRVNRPACYYPYPSEIVADSSCGFDVECQQGFVAFQFVELI